MVAATESLSRSELSTSDKNEAVSKSMSLEKQLENWGWLGPSILNSSIQERKVGRLPCIWDQLGLQCKFKDTQDYTVKASLKAIKQKYNTKQQQSYKKLAMDHVSYGNPTRKQINSQKEQKNYIFLWREK